MANLIERAKEALNGVDYLENIAPDLARLAIAAGDLADVIEAALAKIDDNKPNTAIEWLVSSRRELARFRAITEAPND